MKKKVLTITYTIQLYLECDSYKFNYFSLCWTCGGYLRTLFCAQIDVFFVHTKPRAEVANTCPTKKKSKLYEYDYSSVEA